MNRLFLLLIFLYKKLLSPLLPPACRFTPSCSEYAKEAFETYSFFKALRLSISRISRCHPLHAGGYDPLPRPTNKS
ncbi:membrane protein insertion efficiency factor YidD [Leptospira idonii]|uniref:Putative membrane protein insertion efficiency factor n=1 Tax=Leptospira idonii TaxID=1193500 RepID=A0A4R9M296_9LEPT|nr:membrane protein insertion efficiency factor YidD [Leptospira idonii]TGN20873.1 membrane protein insertion efficiency factor YidD [Leptospira idonii]